MTKLVLILSSFLFATQLMAQFPSAGGTGKYGGKNMNVGHFYGKVVDGKTNKGIDGATVQLTGNKFDTATKTVKPFIYATVLTATNGDFSLENLPVMGNFKLNISNIGFKNYTQPVSFSIKMPQGGSAPTSVSSADASSALGNAQQLINMVDKDLGNIKLEEDASTLAAVTVTASKPFFEMGVDRKIFNVDKNIVSTGQTATEVMKQIPTLNVDIDGNVTLRNATPTLFIDGRPTTLTYDQIPADIIDRVELITNPSAKYDASGGQGGIINIVLKKNNKSGYNGGVRAGVDSRGKMNYGADLNYRQNKINFFFNGAYNQRESKITSSTDRVSTDPLGEVDETGKGINDGYFEFLRAGFDYFIDNRNTLTVGGNLVHGHFDNNQPELIDSSLNGALQSYSNVASLSTFDFKNYGGQLSFKHNFAKANHDITADVNYNTSNNINNSYINTYTYLPDGTSSQDPSLQNTLGNGYNRFLTIQSDYENPLTENTKLEAGVRAAIRNYYSESDKYFFVDSLEKYAYQPEVSSKYKYNDAVYAAYADYTLKTKKWNYQLGLRLESSNYKGVSLDTTNQLNTQTFKTTFPISLFPSAFITYKLNNKEDFQLNFSRRINRPNFFQLSPIINISDPENISIGNPNLKPEFTDAFEFSYDKTYNHGGNFLATVYFKYSTDLITNYVYKALSPVNSSDTAFFNTYENANYSYSYGLELTNKVTIARIWDLTANINFFDSKINGENIQSGVSSSGISWFGKLNNSFKLPKNFSIQFSAFYQAKTVVPASSGGGGPGGFFQPTLTSAQGYINPYYGFDMAVKKDFTWKGGNTISVSVGMNDLFRTETVSTYSVSQYFTQTTTRLRDPQLLRVNLSYRFGKLDASLFKRKNLKADQGMDTSTMSGQ